MSFHHPLINQGKHRKPLLKIIYIELGSAELFSVHRQRVADVDPHSDDNDEILPIQNSHFLIFLIITCGLSLLFTHFLGQKNEEYIGYFHKFESHKNNAVWHVISSIFFIGAICAGIISIMWWNEN